MTKYLSDKFRGETLNKGIVVAGNEWTRDPERGRERKVYCKWCNHLLYRILDSSGNNPALYCTNCSISYGNDDDDLRSKGKIANPERIDNSKNPSVSYAPEVGIQRKKPEITSALKVLQQKGIRITHITENKKRRKEREE
jgi:hypothetical protein